MGSEGPVNRRQSEGMLVSLPLWISGALIQGIAPEQDWRSRCLGRRLHQEELDSAIRRTLQAAECLPVRNPAAPSARPMISALRPR
jgi:hypothetical protein